MKKTTLFICIILLSIGCTNRSIKETSLKNNKHALMDSTEIDSFIDNFIHFERKEVKVFPEKEARRDQGAYFYKTKNFNVLQIGQFGTIGKQEIYYFIKENNISHITNIDFKYNQPYYVKEGFKMKRKKQDYFIEDSSLVLFKLDGNVEIVTDDILCTFEKLKEEGIIYLQNMKEKE